MCPTPVTCRETAAGSRMNDPVRTWVVIGIVLLGVILYGTGACGGYADYPPYNGVDLDCADVDGPVKVDGPDPHGLDADEDGVGCEAG